MRTTLNATEGHILTNGKIYGTTIHLADDVDASGFYEITREEYNAMFVGEDATEEDYLAALGEFGVKV